MKKNNKLNVLNHFNSIKIAMQIPFVLIILSAVLIFLFISLQYTEKMIVNNTISNTTKIINLINSDINSYILDMESISQMMLQSEKEQEYLFNENLSNAKRLELKDELITLFNLAANTRSDIANIAIISSDDRYLINNGFDKLNPYVKYQDVDWLLSDELNGTNFILSSTHVQNVIMDNYQWVVTLSRRIRNPYTNIMQGIYFIDLNYEKISNLCDDNSLGKRGYVFIIDENGEIVYHPQQQLLYSDIKSEQISEVLNCKENFFITDEGDNSRIYNISRSETTGWIVVGVSYNSDLMENKEYTQMIYIVTATILLAISIFVSIRIAASITKPICILKESMELVEQGQFDNVKIMVTTNNEIGILTRSFNMMTVKIQTLIEENCIKQEEKRKSELKALQAQINPHFLYNTLDSIIWMTEGNKNKEAVLMTSALAKLMRQSLSNKLEVISMIQEIDYVRSYLLIQKMRYKDKLEFNIYMDPAIAKDEIVKLVLQPIVENAIYHGIKYKEEMGMLQICAVGEGEKIIIVVRDNGVGMDKNTLEHIFDEHKESYRTNGVGVYNVQKRLKLYYGQGYGITYESTLGMGTIAKIKIPRSTRI